MSRIFTFALLLSLLGSTSHAQHDAMVELYGEGVHRYFDNDFLGADQILTTVVDSGSQDPRVHYFRGLARERSGFDGQLDFEAGARLEAEGRRVVDVGAALARVQGAIRTKIEEARRDARIAVKQQQLMAEQERQPAQPIQPSAPAGSSPFPTDSIPANDAGLAPPPPVPAEPAEANDTSNPFADDDPAVPVPPAADTPTPAESQPAEPFGTSPADAANPFGDAPAPAGDTPPADAVDPFGDPAAPAGDAPPADAAPTDSDNPFGL